MNATRIIERSSCSARATGMIGLASRALFALVLLLGIGAVSVQAQDEHHEDEATESAAKKTVIPKTLPALWAEIVEHQKELREVLAANNLEDVHHVAFTIRDYVAALPGKSKLSADKKKSLKAYVTHVDTLANELDEAGDGGDSTAVAALVGKLDMELSSVEALYVAKDLKPTTTTAATSKQMYVCPMHPEVMSDKPGKCSKCGMALVKKDH